MNKLKVETHRKKRWIKELRRKEERKACRLLGGWYSPVWQGFKKQVREFVLKREEAQKQQAKERREANAS